MKMFPHDSTIHTIRIRDSPKMPPKDQIFWTIRILTAMLFVNAILIRAAPMVQDYNHFADTLTLEQAEKEARAVQFGKISC